jgi:hypothetical protein
MMASRFRTVTGYRWHERAARAARSEERAGSAFGVGEQVTVEQVAPCRMPLTLVASRPRHGFGGGQNPQVPLARKFDRTLGHLDRRRSTRLIARSGRLAHSIGERFEIIARRLERIGVRGDAHDLPADRRCQPLAVGGA